jgi:hypothetical protein
MIKRGILCAFIALAVTVSGFSDEIKVTGTPPTVKTNDPTNIPQSAVDKLNEALESMFDDTLDKMNNTINETIPSGLIDSGNILVGFGNASLFATHGATMRAYGEYKSFSISLGGILGFQVPENTMDLINGDIAVDDFLSSDKLTFGINPQAFNLHVGFHPSSLIAIMPENLYFGLRIGFFGLPNLDIQMSDDVNAKLNFNTFTIGLTANYQLVPSVNLGLIIWRGVNVGSGLIFQTTKLDLSVPIKMEPMPIGDGSSIGGGLDNLSLVLDPTVTLNMNINTVTIPIEIVTAVKLIFLNIPLGVGFDIGFGQSDLSFGLKSGINIEGANSGKIEQEKGGSLSVGISNNVAPQFFNLKLISGLGFAFGEKFMLDIPFTYYFTSSGFNLGMTLGFRF